VQFHLSLRETLPEAAVLAVLHGDDVPTDPEGVPFYHKVIEIASGVAAERPLDRPRLVAVPAE
jgi:hypothetical protein